MFENPKNVFYPSSCKKFSKTLKRGKNPESGCTGTNERHGISFHCKRLWRSCGKNRNGNKSIKYKSI